MEISIKFYQKLLFFTIILFFSVSNFNLIYAQDLTVLHEKTFKILPDKELEVETSVGDVKITGWDKNEVYIKITGNPRAKEDIEFYFNNNSDKVEIKGELDKSFWKSFTSSRYNLHYEIMVPLKFNTNVATAGGDLMLANISGENKLATSGGDIRVNDVKGKLKMATSGGDIDFNDVEGDMKFSTSGGEIFGDNFIGNVQVSTSGGDIKLNGQNSRIKASTSGGDVSLEYSGENKGIELSSSGGDIDVSLPANFNASVYLSSSGGKVSCEFSANNVKEISSHKFEADINNGGNKLVAKTSGGRIKVSHK